MRYVLPAVAFAILVGFFWVGLRLNPGEVPSPLIGKPAPAFELPELSDTSRIISNETLRGQPALLNVWATWCGGCRLEHDLLLAIAAEGNVPIYGLNYRDDRAAALEWLRQLGNPFKAVAYDPEGTVSIDWGVYGAPETFLIDPDGVVVYKHIAPLTLDDWREEFLPRIRAMRGGTR